MDIRITVDQPGGIEALTIQTCPLQEPGTDEIRLRHHAIGINFLDIYHRRGLYPLPPPGVPGVEGAGVVEAVGEGVTDLKPGDRIAYAGTLGAYASCRLLPTVRALLLPKDISMPLAAASLLKGLTAHMLLTRTYPVGPGTIMLIHAAAGGLGMILTRWAKRLGAIVIGTVGNERKAALAQANGADHLIVGQEADLSAAVHKITSGVDYAIDGIGGSTLLQTLNCVRPSGIVASIGRVAGAVPLLETPALVRPSVMAYSADARTYHQAATAVFDMMKTGIIASIGGQYPLADVSHAHEDLENRRTAGSLILLP